MGDTTPSSDDGMTATLDADASAHAATAASNGAAASAGVEAVAGSSNNVLPQLRTRVVREAGRETWFVVNESDDDLATIPLAIVGGSNVRRVQVNGEVAEFSASADLLLVRPRRSLRVGAGTIVSVQLR